MSTTTSAESWPVLLIGAGKAMFGHWDGPWNIAARLEKRLGSRLSVEGVVDIDVPKATTIIEKKREDSTIGSAYAKTFIVSSIKEFAELVAAGKATSPKAVLIAVTPNYRGGLRKGQDIELEVNKHFPHASIFIEKPVTSGYPWEESVRDARQLGEILETKQKGVTSVGYMFRYLEAVAKVKQILKEADLEVMSITFTYATGYDSHINPEAWDKRAFGGPVVEQCTHFCDLARYFGGDVDYDTLFANAVEVDEKIGQFRKMPVDDSYIPMEERIPRTTAATWKFQGGAVCNMLHATALLKFKYETRFQIIADGYDFLIEDFYAKPKLSIRYPNSAEYQVINYSDDPYYTEIDAFIKATEGDRSLVLSPFSDAVKTYELTHRIRAASEVSTARRRAKKNQVAHC